MIHMAGRDEQLKCSWGACGGRDMLIVAIKTTLIMMVWPRRTYTGVSWRRS